jgi:1,2-diacylglycerol 3-alpha-glucosyltransferase
VEAGGERLPVRSLRIGLFTEVYQPLRNGVVTAVEMLGNALRVQGYEVVCVTPTMPGEDHVDEQVVRLPSFPLPTRTGYRLTLPILTREHNAALGALSVVHAHSPFVTGGLAARTARALRVPLIFTYHTQLERYVHYLPCDPHLARWAARRLTRAYANTADVVTVPTMAMERYLRELGVSRRIEIVPGGIDVAHFEAGKRDTALRARYGMGEEDALVLWVGRLGREKNPSLAIEAFARLAVPARMLIVGDGIDRASLECAAERAAPGRVHFIGEQLRAMLPDIYASADLFLFTSASETQGLVLAEALAAGLPIVAVDTLQSREVTGESASFCEPEPYAAARCMQAVLERKPASREECRAVARRYDARVVAARMIEVYNSI